MNTTTPPYTITDDTITAFFDGEPHTTHATPAVVTEFREALEDDERCIERLRRLFDPAVRYAEVAADTGVEISPLAGTVTYKGRRINGHLEQRIFDILDAGLDVDPWKRFAAKCYANPRPEAREELSQFLTAANLPITPDGDFLAYKRVNEDYTDCHSGTFDNSVGQTVTMKRHEVDDDRTRTCSRGLHFCSQGYLRHFVPGRGRIVVVKINPADVVSIPIDYNYTKGRTWRYEVVGEVPTETEEQAIEWGVITYEYVDESITDDDWDDDEYDPDVIFDEDDGWDDDEDDDLPPEVAVENPTPFVAPAPPRKSFWRRWIKGE